MFLRALTRGSRGRDNPGLREVSLSGNFSVDGDKQERRRGRPPVEERLRSSSGGWCGRWASLVGGDDATAHPEARQTECLSPRPWDRLSACRVHPNRPPKPNTVRRPTAYLAEVTSLSPGLPPLRLPRVGRAQHDIYPERVVGASIAGQTWDSHAFSRCERQSFQDRRCF